MEKRSKLSESFIVGAVTMVFLIVGYQTAAFVYHASVMKIVSNRDHPDTVYVCHQGDFGDTCRSETVIHTVSIHSPTAEAVRTSSPYRKVESFRFNPNSVTVEELCRLGFSQKQAQAIENYRAKGGRFNRKEDFAKSYVVSDSVYRRLETYIDIPLIDLNLADSAAFDSLPGIGGWFANKMIEHREALCGYSCKEQLKDIYNFTDEKYLGLEDLVTVSEEYITPYPLWELPADSLRKHPYIKDYETARSIVLYRENSDGADLTVEGLLKAGILTPVNAARLSKCKIRSPR